jgi:hypothetical protein
MATPWMVQEGSGFTSSWAAVPWAAGGHAWAVRADAAERAQERREAQERAERVEARYDACVAMAMRHAVLSGLAWHPSRPFEHWPSPEAQGDAIAAQEDRESRRHEFQAARAAGLVHLLNVAPGDMAAGEVVLEPADVVAERADRTEMVRLTRRCRLEKIRAAARRALRHTGRPGTGGSR